jgi:hypothetical protein
MKRWLVAISTALATLAFSSPAAQAGTVLTQAESTTAIEQAEAAGTIESIEAATGSQEAVETAFNPEVRTLASINPSMRPSVPLNLVVIHGHFKDVNAKARPNAPAPTGTVMSFVINRDNGRIAATSVRNTTPTLPSGTIERPAITPSIKARSASLRKRPRRSLARTATWGNNCKPSPETDHCYITTSWYMKGAEEVHGVYDEQDTAHISVPGWQHGYFVDNEVWASQPQVPNTWTEIGQQAGEGKGCCSLWWFYAFKNGTEGYNEYVEAPYVWEVAEGIGNDYAMKTPGSGIWCWYTGSGFELHACAADFAWQATELEAGGEVATEEKPSFAASTNNSAEWTNGTWHTWNFAIVEATTGGLCSSPLNGAPGNIYYDTC